MLELVQVRKTSEYGRGGGAKGQSLCRNGLGLVYTFGFWLSQVRVEVVSVALAKGAGQSYWRMGGLMTVRVAGVPRVPSIWAATQGRVRSCRSGSNTGARATVAIDYFRFK